MGTEIPTVQGSPNGAKIESGLTVIEQLGMGKEKGEMETVGRLQIEKRIDRLCPQPQVSLALVKDRQVIRDIVGF